MEEKTVNEHILKLSGKASIPTGLTLSRTYQLQLTGDVTSVSESDNQDGTVNKSYRFEPLVVEVINDKGNRIVSKDRTKTSSKNRSRHHIWQAETLSDIGYDKAYEFIRRHFDAVMELVIRIENGS